MALSGHRPGRTWIAVLLVCAFSPIAFAAGTAPAKAVGPTAKAVVKPTPDAANVKYGPYERNVLDLWLAEGEGPRPLVMYIHGGGFIAGDKSGLDAEELTDFLQAGLSVAAINYRYSTIAPFPAPMHDAARAVQFLRYHAADWRLDPERFAATGGSAGGMIALWLAFHDDLADPSNEDPVLRQSTRLTCAAPVSAPTTVIMSDYLEWVGEHAKVHPATFPLFGITTVEECSSPEIQRLMAEASPIELLTPDDPPVFMNYGLPNTPLGPESTPKEQVHHPLFGIRLKVAMDALGVEAVLRYPDHCEDSYEDKTDFLSKKLVPTHPAAEQ